MKSSLAGRLPSTTGRLHLTRRHREEVTALLRRHVPDAEVWAYGSRVGGRSHDGSDLDLVLRTADGQPLALGQLARLTAAFRESNIPFLVEARDWAHLPESFRQEIVRRHVVLVPAKPSRD